MARPSHKKIGVESRAVRLVETFLEARAQFRGQDSKKVMQAFRFWVATVPASGLSERKMWADFARSVRKMSRGSR